MATRADCTTRNLTPKLLADLREIRRFLGGVPEAPRSELRHAWVSLLPPAKYAPEGIVKNGYLLRPDEHDLMVILDESKIPNVPFPPKRQSRKTSA
jgi:hypothetical protein